MGGLPNYNPTLSQDSNTDLDDYFDGNLILGQISDNYNENISNDSNLVDEDYDEDYDYEDNDIATSPVKIVRKKIDYAQLTFGCILILICVYSCICIILKNRQFDEKIDQEIIVTEKILNHTTIDISCFNKLTNTEYKCYNTTYDIGYLVNDTKSIITNSSYFVCTDINVDCVLAYDKLTSKLQIVYYFDDNVQDYKYESKSINSNTVYRIAGAIFFSSLIGIALSFNLIADSINGK
jgi:hypothetical protein